jgi:hypothetical protein
MMNTKVLIAALAGGVAAYLLGWVIWGMVLMGFMEANMTVYEGLVKSEMNLLVMFVSCLIWGFLLAWVYSCFSGKKSLAGGAVTGGIIGLLVAAGLDLNFLANWNLYTPVAMVADILANGVYSAGVGAVVGWILRDKPSMAA